MKLFVVTAVILFFVEVFASEEKEEKEEKSEAGCDTWPSNLLPLKECCQVPYRLSCPWELGCSKICSDENVGLNISTFSINEEQVDKLRTCIEECFIKFPNALVNSEKKINKTIAARLYIHKNTLANVDWRSQIIEATEKCELGSSNSLSANLGQYFYCVDEHLVKNCKEFKRHEGCGEVEDHYKKCNQIQPNCSFWPMDILNPKLCCDAPVLLNEKIIDGCYEKCEETEYFKQLEAFCIHECIFAETKIRVDDKYDFEVIKKVINENANKSIDWTTAIDKAVEICEKNITDTAKNHASGERDLLNTLLMCLRSNLAGACPELRNTKECNRVKRFMKECPDLKPSDIAHY